MVTNGTQSSFSGGASMSIYVLFCNSIRA